MMDYALHGVWEYWIVDVEYETVEQYYVLKENTFQLAQKLKDGTLALEVIAGFKIDVKSIFEE